MALKADIGGPIVQLLLAVAAIALAIIVISMLTPPPPKPTFVGNPEIVRLSGQHILHFTIKNPSSKVAHVTGITVETDTGATTIDLSRCSINLPGTTTPPTWSPSTISPGETITIRCTLSGAFGKKDQYSIIIDSDVGSISSKAIYRG